MNTKAFVKLHKFEVEEYDKRPKCAKKLYRRRGDILNHSSYDTIVVEYQLVEVGRYTKAEWEKANQK